MNITKVTCLYLCIKDKESNESMFRDILQPKSLEFKKGQVFAFEKEPDKEYFELIGSVKIDKEV